MDPWTLFLTGLYVALGVSVVAGPFAWAHHMLTKPKRPRMTRPEIVWGGDK